jgi:hypothetical protein
MSNQEEEDAMAKATIAVDFPANIDDKISKQQKEFDLDSNCLLTPYSFIIQNSTPTSS